MRRRTRQIEFQHIVGEHARLHPLELGAGYGLALGILRVLDIPLGILGGEGPSGVKGHAVAQLEGELQVVGRQCPGFGQSGGGLRIRVEAYQGVEHCPAKNGLRRAGGVGVGIQDLCKLSDDQAAALFRDSWCRIRIGDRCRGYTRAGQWEWCARDGYAQPRDSSPEVCEDLAARGALGLHECVLSAWLAAMLSYRSSSKNRPSEASPRTA